MRIFVGLGVKKNERPAGYYDRAFEKMGISSNRTTHDCKIGKHIGKEVELAFSLRRLIWCRYYLTALRKGVDK